MALISLNNLALSYGEPPLFEDLNLQINAGERLCLLGRNGAGKSTLMKVISGSVLPDSGDVSRQKKIRIALLDQDVPEELNGSVHEVVSADLPVHQTGPPLVDIVLTRMQLDPYASFETLSVGLKRRTLLARALATSPDILLLDEPTNHLDIEAIAWLEAFLLKQRFTILFVTHDRLLTRHLATRILELDQGRLASWECDYPTYLKRREELAAAEADQQKQFNRKLAEEEVWIRQGIRARRTRNEGRVRALESMREARRNRRPETGDVRLQVNTGEKSSKRVIVAKDLSFSYGETKVVDGFSTTIQRGDKIGFIGPNGVGKTTLLRLLLGDLQPHQGTVTHGMRLQVAYFDQLREQLDDERTVFETVAEGTDQVTFNGKSKHVISYLKDFLFTPARSRSPVKVLSGGERNRLLLAKLFTSPANVLALDEPTNDLDAETLEILEAMVVDFTGTVLLISHDRTFLDNVVTSTIAFEGEHDIHEYVGGYDDWLRQRRNPRPEVEKAKTDGNDRKSPTQRRSKFSYNDQRELSGLPARIDAMETIRQDLYAALADPNSYTDGTDIPDLNNRLERANDELEAAYLRWEALEASREG